MRTILIATGLLLMTAAMQSAALGPIGENANRSYLISQLPQWDPRADATLTTEDGVIHLRAGAGLDRIVQRLDDLDISLPQAEAFALEEAAAGEATLPLAGDVVVSEVGSGSCPAPEIVEDSSSLDLFLDAPTSSGEWSYGASGYASSDVSVDGDGLAVMFVGGQEVAAAFYNANVVYGGNASFMCLSFFDIVLNVPTFYGLIAEE